MEKEDKISTKKRMFLQSCRHLQIKLKALKKKKRKSCKKIIQCPLHHTWAIRLRHCAKQRT